MATVLTEVMIVGVLAALGVLAYRETIALRRWDAGFWRKGLVVLRQAAPVGHQPVVLPEPNVPSSWLGWRSRVQRIAPLEIAFTAQSSNWPLMKGLVSFDDSSNAVVVTGRLFWGVLPLFVVGLGGSMLLFQPSAGLWVCSFLAGFVLVDYVSERAKFIQTLHSVTAQMAQGKP